jgi:hypothetical protein
MNFDDHNNLEILLFRIGVVLHRVTLWIDYHFASADQGIQMYANGLSSEFSFHIRAL